MVGVIFGQQGAGKTKKLLETANASVKVAKGSLVFIDNDNSYMFDLDHAIRFINVSDYAIESPKMLYGFLCGLAASDFDLEYIYIDRFRKITGHDVSTLEAFFEDLVVFSEKNHVNIIMSATVDGEAPEFLKKLALAD